MKAFVLVIVVGMGSFGSTVTTQEFSTRELCESAKQFVLNSDKKFDGDIMAGCFEK